jgi:hypothetical protein
MKKNFLLCSMLLSSVVSFAAEEFSPERFTWTYSVKPKSSEMSDFVRFNGQLHEMIIQVHRGENSSMYQQMLNFMKELQEAIVAGYNLFGAVVTSKESYVQIAAEAAEAIVEEVSTSEESSNVVTKACDVSEEASVEAVESEAAVAVDPALIITLTCSVVDETGLENWNLATTMLQDLADSMNNGSITPDEVIASLTSIYDVLIKMSNAGLSLTSANL